MHGAAVFCFGAEEIYSGAEQGGAGQEAKSSGAVRGKGQTLPGWGIFKEGKKTVNQ